MKKENKNRKVIWVLGASSGIGKAIAKEFARIGCIVYASSRKKIDLEQLANELAEEKLSINILPCNIASYQNVDICSKKILLEGRIDCLVNAAGITSFKPAIDNSMNEVIDIINTNLLGSIFSIKSVLPKMIEQRRGTIINILSTVIEKIFTNSSAYSASKSGLLAYTNVLREEMRENNIRIINIAPGPTDTPMWAQEIRKENSHRMMTSEEIAQTVIWSFLNDENLVVEKMILRPIKGDL